MLAVAALLLLMLLWVPVACAGASSSSHACFSLEDLPVWFTFLLFARPRQTQRYFGTFLPLWPVLAQRQAKAKTTLNLTGGSTNSEAVHAAALARHQSSHMRGHNAKMVLVYF